MFTHRSYFARPTHIFEDHPDDPSPDNEKFVAAPDIINAELESDRLAGRYEHLGDTVLGLAVTSLMLEMYPCLRVGPSTVRSPTPAASTAIRAVNLPPSNYLFQKIRALIVGNYTLAEMWVSFLMCTGSMMC